jgi:4-amino-4-deoxy-L-arabinose transferase-like glycosyltransferase
VRRWWLEALVLVAILGAGLWLRWTPLSDVEDLRPRPDAVEYEEAARNLRDGEGYCVVVEGGKYPPRYPFGFSMLLVPVLFLWDRGPGSGVVVVIASALLTIVACWRLGHRAGGMAAAAAAAALIAAVPAHVRSSRVVMSDVPAAAAIAWLAVAILGAGAAGVRTWAAIGAGVGLVASLRTVNHLMLLPAAWVAVAARGAWRRRLAALAAGAVVGLVPLVAYNVVRFGDPLRSGYDFWSPYPLLSPAFALGSPQGGRAWPNLPYYLHALSGFGTLYTWPFAVLVAGGCVMGWWRGGPARRLVAIMLALLVPLFALQTMFIWQGDRFLVSALPLMMAVAAIPFGPGGAVPRVAAVGLAVWGIAMTPFSSPLYRGEAISNEASYLRALDAELPANAALLVRANEALFRRIVRRPGTDRVWLPLALDEHQSAVRRHRLAPYAPARDDGRWIRQGIDATTAERMIGALLDEGRPVYALRGGSNAGVYAVLGRRFRVVPTGDRWLRIERDATSR